VSSLAVAAARAASTLSASPAPPSRAAVASWRLSAAASARVSARSTRGDMARASSGTSSQTMVRRSRCSYAASFRRSPWMNLCGNQIFKPTSMCA